MSLRNNIMRMLNDIECMDNDKGRVLETSIKDRLSTSLSTYASTMSYSLDYLQRKKPVKVLRMVNKE